MALQGDRGVRKRFKMPLLDRHHAALLASSVAGYARETLQTGYWLAVLIHPRTPISRFASNMSAYVWWPQLARILDAVEDLDCLDLLEWICFGVRCCAVRVVLSGSLRVPVRLRLAVDAYLVPT